MKATIKRFTKSIIISIIISIILASCASVAPYRATTRTLGTKYEQIDGRHTLATTTVGIRFNSEKAYKDVLTKYTRLIDIVPLSAKDDRAKATAAALSYVHSVDSHPYLATYKEIEDQSNLYVETCNTFKKISKKYDCFDRVFKED